MSLSPVEIVDETVLRRPQYDVYCEPGLVSSYYENGADYHMIRRKGSASSYLTYSVSGSGFFRDGKNQLLRTEPGDLVLVDALAYQEYGTYPGAKDWKCHWVHFDAQPHWAHWLPLPVRTGLHGVTSMQVEARSAEQLGELFFRLHNECRLIETSGNVVAFDVLERILIVARTGATDAPTTPLDPRIARVWQLIESSAPNSPSSKALSRVAGISHSRLACVFKQTTGITILAAVNRVRLRAAQRALQEVGMSVSAAAERAGFQSPYSFSNWYLKQTGLRPAEYRKRWFERTQASALVKCEDSRAARRMVQKLPRR
jgi:AraC-like DNA-binding protein